MVDTSRPNEGSPMSGGGHWPEVLHTYDPALKAAYHEGILFRQWLEKYRGHMLFCPYMLSSRQIPHSGPIPGPLGFGELLMGTRYLDAGYEAIFLYRDNEDRASHKMLCDLVGGASAGQFIAPNGEKGGRPPDLLVVHPGSGRFRFVECKRPGERLTKTQPAKFAATEGLLSRNCDRGHCLLTDANNPTLFPSLSDGKWIHIVRLAPETGTRRAA